jgi:AraC family transcriptional regulator of adaptative response / DNA-3-methyladenine glycosylase II
VPRTVDGFELAVRVIIGQQISTAAARTHTSRIVGALGGPITADGSLNATFPTPEDLAKMAPETMALPAARARTVIALAEQVASGDLVLDPGTERRDASSVLRQIPGIGPWTEQTIAMRALGDPDAFLVSDLGVMRAAQGLGIASGGELKRRSERWRPWRAYATQYLWSAVDHPIVRLPEGPHS